MDFFQNQELARRNTHVLVLLYALAVAAATADGTVQLGEAELLRLVGAVLDCPLPPFIDALDPATLPA